MADQDELDPFLATIARELKRPVHLDARFDERVMASLEPGVIPLPSARRMPVLQPWYRRTLSVTVTPLRALATAAALTGIVAFSLVRARSTPDTQVARLPDHSLIMTPVANTTPAPGSDVEQKQFIIMVPGAKTVSLVGDFNDWDATKTPMERVSDDGAWSVTLPLHAGRYEFQYEIDGVRRMTDPSRLQTSSDFGSPNSIVTIEGKE